MSDVRIHAPAAERNREPILDVLRQSLPRQGVVLEIASGSGQHVAYFAEAFPNVQFQPSDPDPRARASIEAWAAHRGLTNVRPALPLDVAAEDPWPVADAAAIICINMVHISPWPATVGLMRGAARTLAAGGLLYLYGPYKRGGAHTAPSNEAFDSWLRAQNPAWGVRDLEAVVAEAEKNHLTFATLVAMPANNVSLLFTR